jgi:hypothetical protein
LEDVDPKWATQLSIYAWLVGVSIGGEFVAAIDQLVCSPNGDQPTIRVAEHRTMVGAIFQRATLYDARMIWLRCQSGHFYPEVSLAESQEKCALLDEQAKMLCQPDGDREKYFAEVCRR